VLPLRLDTLIYSGIAPPPEILERIAQARANANAMNPPSAQPSAALEEKLKTEGRKSSIPVHVDAGPSSAINGSSTTNLPVVPSVPARPGGSSYAEHVDFDDAPPSYEGKKFAEQALSRL